MAAGGVRCFVVRIWGLKSFLTCPLSIDIHDKQTFKDGINDPIGQVSGLRLSPWEQASFSLRSTTRSEGCSSSRTDSAIYMKYLKCLCLFPSRPSFTLKHWHEPVRGGWWITLKWTPLVPVGYKWNLMVIIWYVIKCNLTSIQTAEIRFSCSPPSLGTRYDPGKLVLML